MVLMKEKQYTVYSTITKPHGVVSMSNSYAITLHKAMMYIQVATANFLMHLKSISYKAS